MILTVKCQKFYHDALRILKVVWNWRANQTAASVFCRLSTLQLVKQTVSKASMVEWGYEHGRYVFYYNKIMYIMIFQCFQLLFLKVKYMVLEVLWERSLMHWFTGRNIHFLKSEFGILIVKEKVHTLIKDMLRTIIRGSYCVTKRGMFPFIASFYSFFFFPSFLLPFIFLFPHLLLCHILSPLIFISLSLVLW